MKKLEKMRIGLVMTLFLEGLVCATGCRATVAGDPDRPIRIEAHITLDVRQVKEAANSIEDMVSGKKPVPPKKSSRLGEWLVGSAWAESPQLKTMTPEIQKLVDSRKERFDALKSAKTQGWIGEDNRGYVAPLGGGPEIPALVGAENQDRETIYRAIVAQNGLPADAIQTVESGFAQVQRERAEPGEMIQSPAGEWVAK